LQLTYHKTTLLYERLNKKTTGLDPLAVRTTPIVPGDPPLPIASTNDPRLSLDVEGTCRTRMGRTYFFLFSCQFENLAFRKGFGSAMNTALTSISIKKMVIFSLLSNLLMRWYPMTALGTLIFLLQILRLEGLPKPGYDFESTCRGPYSYISPIGLEGLTLDEANSTLYAMLQSATIQDGGNAKNTSRYTRLLAWDVSNPSKPTFQGRMGRPLPVNPKGTRWLVVRFNFVSNNVFLALSRDGDGRGGGDTTSKYK
jgi:hypothetical protein